MNNFEEIYKKTVRKLGDVVEDVRFSRQLNLESMEGYAEEIAEYLKKHDNILSMGFDGDEAYPYMLTHPVNVAIISGVIGKWLRLSEADIVRLICSGLLHDIGKSRIRDSILNKPDKLSSGELEIARNHPLYGYQLLAKLDLFDEDILSGVMHHHERLDGSGYPNHLKGDEIPLFARIIAVADIYNAMTSTKSYKDKCSPFKVVGEIEVSRFESLDPKICQVFLDNILNYYPGNKVRLNNDRVGTIICVNPGEYMRPVIYCEDEQFDLIKERDLEIVEIITRKKIIIEESNSKTENEKANITGEVTSNGEVNSVEEIANKEIDSNQEYEAVDKGKELGIEDKIV